MINMHPNHSCPGLRSGTVTTTSSLITSVAGGCAWLVRTTDFSALRINPARPTATINLSESCAASGPEFAKSGISSAKCSSTRFGNQSRQIHGIFLTVAVFNIARHHDRVVNKSLKLTSLRGAMRTIVSSVKSMGVAY